jgi:ABC-type transporter Mla subunit MlaD
MRWVSRLVTVGLAVVLVGTIALLIVLKVRQPSKFHFETSAGFRDASRLPVGSRVMIAGVQVGEIVGLTVDGRLARVSMRLQDDIALYDDAWAEKKAESLFGDGYIEIHPGGPEDGHRRLVSGDPIPRVHEGASTDRTLRAVDQGMPRAQEALDNAQAYAEAARIWVDGDLTETLEDLEEDTRDPELFGGLARAQAALDDFDRSTADAEGAVAEFRPEVAPALDSANRDIQDFTGDVREGKQSVREGLGDARKRIDEVDPYLEDAAEFFAGIDAAEFVDDPELGNQIADATETGAEATGTFGRLESFVGLRLELDILARQPTVALGFEISGSADSFYFLEIARHGTGLFAEAQISDRLPDDTYVRTATANDGLLLTLQWGHRFEHTSVRFGLRESEFAAGVDNSFLDGRIELHSDIFLPSYRKVPRVKLAAAMRLYQSVYVMGGVDDVLRNGQDVPIQPWPADQPVPQALSRVHDGRDYFVGGYLRFSDRDLDLLLLLYGAAIFSTL